GCAGRDMRRLSAFWRRSPLQEAHRLVELDFALGQTPQHGCAPLPVPVAARALVRRALVRRAQGGHDVIEAIARRVIGDVQIGGYSLHVAAIAHEMADELQLLRRQTADPPQAKCALDHEAALGASSRVTSNSPPVTGSRVISGFGGPPPLVRAPL